MPTILATPEPGNLPPRTLLEVDFSDVVPVPAEATVTRLDMDGRTRAVRLAEPAELQSGVWVGYDYESPLGQSAKYTGTAGTDSVTTPAVTLAAGVVLWLRHPGVPDLSVSFALAAVRKDSFTTRARATTRATFEPLGRSVPLVVTGGARKAPQTEMTLRTDTLTALDAMWAVLEDESVLLLDIPAAQGWGVFHEYVSIGDVAEARVADWGSYQGRWWSLPYLVVDRPEGGLRAQFTYADVLAEEADYAAVLDDYATYQDLLTNRRRIGALAGYGEGGYGDGVFGL